MSSNSGNLEVALVLGFGAGIATFFKGFRTYRKYRIVEDTPEIPIRSIPMGLVHIHGRAKGEQMVPSPVSHTPCYFYKVDIEKWKTEEHSSGWRHYRTDVDGVKFYLEDGSGKVLVDARSAEYDLEKFLQREVRSDLSSSSIATRGATDAELLGYVNKVTAAKVFGFVGRRLEALGPVHDPGKEQMRLAALDIFKHPPGTPGFLEHMVSTQMAVFQSKVLAHLPPGDARREPVAQALAEAGKHPLGSPEFLQGIRRAYDLAGPIAGMPTMDEQRWQQVSESMQHVQERQAASSSLAPASGRYRFTEYCIVPDHDYDVTGTCAENPEPKDQHDRNHIMKGSNEPTFLISSKTEPEVESGLRKQAALMIFGGAALAVVCLGLLLAKLNLL
jgi:hypothetical protein